MGYIWCRDYLYSSVKNVNSEMESFEGLFETYGKALRPLKYVNKSQQRGGIVPWLDVMGLEKRSSVLIFSGAVKSQGEMLSQNFYE